MGPDQEVKLFGDCLGAIYGAVADTDGWRNAALQVQRHIGTDFVNILYVHPERMIVGAACAGLTTDQIDDYLSRWRFQDPLVSAQLMLPPQRSLPVERLVDKSRLQTFDVFEGFYEPVGMIYQAASHRPIGNGWFSMVSVQNGQRRGDVSPGMLRRLDELMPHLRNAFRLSERIQTLDAQSRVGDILLKDSRTGVLLCEPCGRVIDVNTAGDAILQEVSDLLRLRSGRLEAADAVVHRSLKALLADPMAAPFQGKSPTLSFSDRWGRKALDCTVLQFEPAWSSTSRERLRMVLLSRGSAYSDIDARYLRYRFKLTRTEASVLARLMEGIDLTGIAEARGSTLETIRSYVKSLLRKLGCHTQAQLVAKAWRATVTIAPPITPS